MSSELKRKLRQVVENPAADAPPRKRSKKNSKPKEKPLSAGEMKLHKQHSEAMRALWQPVSNPLIPSRKNPKTQYKNNKEQNKQKQKETVSQDLTQESEDDTLSDAHWTPVEKKEKNHIRNKLGLDSATTIQLPNLDEHEQEKPDANPFRDKEFLQLSVVSAKEVLEQLAPNFNLEKVQHHKAQNWEAYENQALKVAMLENMYNENWEDLSFNRVVTLLGEYVYTLGLMVKVDKERRRSQHSFKGRINRAANDEKGTDLQKVTTAFVDRYRRTAKPTTNTDVLQAALEKSSKNKKKNQYECLQEAINHTNEEFTNTMGKLITGFERITNAIVDTRNQTSVNDGPSQGNGVDRDSKQQVDPQMEKLEKDFKKALYAKHACSSGLIRERLDNVRVQLHQPHIKKELLKEFDWWQKDALNVESTDFWPLMCKIAENMSAP